MIRARVSYARAYCAAPLMHEFLHSAAFVARFLRHLSLRASNVKDCEGAGSEAARREWEYEKYLHDKNRRRREWRRAQGVRAREGKVEGGKWKVDSGRWKVDSAEWEVKSER